MYPAENTLFPLFEEKMRTFLRPQPIVDKRLVEIALHPWYAEGTKGVDHMTLGNKIQALRKQAGFSQETLADAMGVSRQAVSKWETEQSYPDTENLLALAELFQVSADELAGLRHEASPAEPPEKKRNTKLFWLLPAVLAAIALLILVFRPDTAPSPAQPDTAEIGEFSLLWQNGQQWEYLSVGTQDSLFPFGTTLQPSALEDVRSTDFANTTLHRAACGTLTVQYLHIEEPVSEIVCSMETISAEYRTPRGICAGSDESAVLDAYGDTLVFCVKETGGDILCQHDYLYAYAPPEAFGNVVLFYIKNGHVAGLAVRQGNDAGSDAWAVNHSTIFPVKNGAVDFGQRNDPEQEPADATQTAYIALYALENDKNLSAEETYRYRRGIYDNLQFLDWQSYGALGEAGQETQTTEALLGWLIDQQTLSEDELRGLLLGACRSSLDGWATDSYCIALSKAFIAYPEVYLRILTGDHFTDEERQMIVSMTGYGCDVPEEFHQAALSEAEALIYHTGLSDETMLRWGTALLERLRDPL